MSGVGGASTIYNDIGSNESIGTGDEILATVTLPAGTYLLHGFVNVHKNGNYTIGGYFRLRQDTTNLCYARYFKSHEEDRESTGHTLDWIVSPTTTTSYNLYWDFTDGNGNSTDLGVHGLIATACIDEGSS